MVTGSFGGGLALVAIVAACGLGGCQTATVVKALPESDIGRIGIGKVSVAYNLRDTSMQSDLSAEFKQDLEAKIEKAARHCGAGELTRDVTVSIEYYRRANAAMTILIGDSNQLHGTVSFRDPAASDSAGIYKIAVAEGGGGLLGVAIMANGDDWMSREFGSRICTQILKRTAPTKEAFGAKEPAAAPTAPATTPSAPPAPAAATPPVS